MLTINKTQIAFIFAGVFVATLLVLMLLVSIFEHRQEERLKYLKLVEIPRNEPDHSKWRINFPREHDSFMKTLKTAELNKYSKWGRYGGSENFSKLQTHFELKRMFAGYPFSVEYTEERGHMYSFIDMFSTKRLGDKKPGACLHCHAGAVFTVIGNMGAEKFYGSLVKDIVKQYSWTHSITCADCHDAETMDLQVTRPGFKEAMQRKGVDLSKATRQEMRAYVCCQCHVEYYFRKGDNYLIYPWDRGFNIDDIEAYYDGIDFYDWVHEESKTQMLKMQHPECELWSTGIHARAKVTCADCHMPYRREGAVKITDHWVQSPLLNLNNACLICHRETEEEMRSRVFEIQDKTHALLTRSEKAILSAIDTIREAMNASVTDDALHEARKLHRKAQMRWDFISSENSMGFHSPQEAARILADSIDYARQAQISAYKAMFKKP